MSAILALHPSMCVQKCVHTKQKSAGINIPTLFYLVRKMGLEPTRHRHTHLKRACLPIPALPQIAFDCKKDSSTFGGIKSSPILYLFSCAIKRPLQPFLSFITVILPRKLFAGAVFAPTYEDGRCLLGNRRGSIPYAPVKFHAAAHRRGRTLFAPTAHIWLCVGGGVPDAPGKSRYDA